MTKNTTHKLIICFAIPLILGAAVLISRNVKANSECSYNYERWGAGATYYYYNNIPVNPEKCGLCLGNVVSDCETLSQSECEKSYHTNPYYLPGIDDIDNTLALNDSYGFQCVWNDYDYPVSPQGYIWSGNRKIYLPPPGCSSFGFKWIEIWEPPKDELYYTYKPCSPPPSCEERCQKQYNRDGACLLSTEAQASSNYPDALKQRGGYRDCLQGTSCYCENHKLEVKGISFGLDEQYQEHLTKVMQFFSPMEDIVSEYELEHLVCQAKISDGDEEDREWIAKHPPDFELLYSRTVNGTFKRLSKIPKSYTKCELLDDGTINCKASVSAMIAKKIKRGMLLKCKVTPKDLYQEGQPKTSSPIGVADHLYYFFKEGLTWTGLPALYETFLDMSAVTDSIQDMTDRTKRLGKAYFYKDRLSLPVNFSGWRRDNAFRDAVKKLGIKFEKRKDDKITLISGLHMALFNAEHKDMYSGSEGLEAGGYTQSGQDLIFLVSNPRLFNFAHEMGHASRASRLCDEYDRGFWSRQTLGLFVSGGLSRCRNPFPNCCNENEDCGRPDQYQCPGMPYYPDHDTSQPDYISTSLIMPQEYSIWRSVMGRYELTILDPIYPKEARCPLRNCK